MKARLVACLAALLLGGCGYEAASPLPSPGPASTPTPIPLASPAPPTATLAPALAALPTGEPDLLALLPAGNQLLATAKTDLDGDGRAEWVVLAGKVGQPAFETVTPLVIAARPGGFAVVWRGQVDFAVSGSGQLQVVDLTGDGRPEIIYQNASKVGGVYAFVYAGSGQAEQHPPVRPQGGACAGLDFFCGWALDIGPPDGAGRRPLIVLADRNGARQYYRWTGSALAAAETMTGTPWPADRPTPPVVRPGDPAAFDVSGSEGGTTVVDRLESDLDGDGTAEIAALTTPLGEDRLHIAIFAWGAPPGQPDMYRLVWQAGPLAGTENQVFKVRDLTGDGRPELLSGQGGGDADGGTLYVVGHTAAGYALLRPQGGRFAGKDSFGAGSYEVHVQATNKPPQLWARSGPDGQQVDIYVWKDGAFQFQP